MSNKNCDETPSKYFLPRSNTPFPIDVDNPLAVPQTSQIPKAPIRKNWEEKEVQILIHVMKKFWPILRNSRDKITKGEVWNQVIEEFYMLLPGIIHIN